MVQTLLLLLLSVYVGYSVTSAKEGDGGAYYYANWCNQHELEYLDDRLCQKVFPSYTSSDSRSFTCSVSPTSRSSAEAMGYVPEAPFSAASRVDTSTLLHHVSEKLHESVRLCMSLVRRVMAQEGVGGQDDVQLYTKYVCLGEASVSDAYETWSSSKVFAAAFAAGELRSARTRSEACQEGSLGIDACTTGKHGVTPLGDLVTIVASYDESQNYTSNSVAAYFNVLAFRQREFDLVQDWLQDVGGGERQVDSQSLGGDYGEAVPSDLGFSYTPAPCVDVTAQGETEESCPVLHDSTSKPNELKHSNSLSALSHAELTRRLVLHRETHEALRFPGTTWEDHEYILYGTGGGKGSLFPNVSWGGMSADPGIFLQAATDLPQQEEKAPGQWRVFSKLGAGYSSVREVGEILTNAYGCLPGDGADGTDGREFTVHVRASRPNDVTLVEAQEYVVQAMREAMAALEGGYLD